MQTNNTNNSYYSDDSEFITNTTKRQKINDSEHVIPIIIHTFNFSNIITKNDYMFEKCNEHIKVSNGLYYINLIDILKNHELNYVINLFDLDILPFNITKQPYEKMGFILFV